MKLDNEQAKQTYGIINQIWKFLKEYGNPENNDEYWEKVVEITSAMDDGDALHRQMIVGTLKGLEKRKKENDVSIREKKGKGR